MYLRAIHGDDLKFDQLKNMPSAGASGGIVGAFLALFGDRTNVVSGLDFVANLTDLK